MAKLSFALSSDVLLIPIAALPLLTVEAADCGMLKTSPMGVETR